MNFSWIINTHKNLNYLKLAIESIRKNAYYKGAPIIVYVENDRESAQWLLEQSDIQPIIEYNDIPKGIGGGVNEAIERVKTEYFNLIHSDMWIGKDYDKALIECYQSTGLNTTAPLFISATRIEPNVFGPYQNSRPGTIVVPKEAFGEFHHNFDGVEFTNWAEDFVKSNPPYFHRKLEGVSYFGKTEDFLRTGMNDPIFSPASFEDHDLTIRMMCMGYEFVTTNQAIVYHFGARGSIFRGDDLTIRHPRQVKAEQDNQAKWMKKWGEMFTEDETGFIKLTPTLQKRYSEIYNLPKYERQNAFADKWLNKTVRLKETSDYQLPRTNYTVTAALLEWEDNGETIFAIMSSEYNLPDKPWFFTMKFGKDCILDGKIEKHFDIL